MRLSLRLILSLIGGVTAVSLVFAIHQAGTEMQAEKVEVQRQALVLAESQQRLVCESATRNSGGASVRQRSMTLGQRG